MTKREFTSASVKNSERMKKIKGKGTKIEVAMEKILKELHVSYSSQPKMIGRPDFVIQEYMIVIFCDSSFWHGRNPDDLSGRNFKRNKELWVEKLTKTVERDKKISADLAKMGWKVLRFWDSELLRFPDECKKRILREMKSNR